MNDFSNEKYKYQTLQTVYICQNVETSPTVYICQCVDGSVNSIKVVGFSEEFGETSFRETNRLDQRQGVVCWSPLVTRPKTRLSKRKRSYSILT